MELIDTHCHLTFDDLVGDINGVIERSRAAGVTGWIAVGTDMNENRKALELTNRFDNLYAALAIHPHDARTVTAKTMDELRRLAQHRRVVAIGETGLDYFYDNSLHEDQRRVFADHLEIAAELNLPVIIHSRKAFDETIEILQPYTAKLPGVLFHCFSGSAEQAEIVLKQGFYISFTGVVTFNNAEKTRRAASVVPLDRFMLETDCPYMSPEPMRKQKINEPALLIHTARFLADLKGVPFEELASATTANAKSFFSLPH